jgi:hypothetical protein
VKIFANVPSAMLYSHVPEMVVRMAKFPSGVNAHLLSDDMVVETTLHVPVLIWYLRKPKTVVDDAFPAKNTKSA